MIDSSEKSVIETPQTAANHTAARTAGNGSASMTLNPNHNIIVIAVSKHVDILSVQLRCCAGTFHYLNVPRHYLTYLHYFSLNCLIFNYLDLCEVYPQH